MQYSPDTQYTPRGSLSLSVCLSFLSLSFSLSYFSSINNNTELLTSLLAHVITVLFLLFLFFLPFFLLSLFSFLAVFPFVCYPTATTTLLLPYTNSLRPFFLSLSLSFILLLLLPPPRSLLRCLLSSDHEAMLALQITRRELVLILSVFDLVQTP